MFGIGPSACPPLHLSASRSKLLQIYSNDAKHSFYYVTAHVCPLASFATESMALADCPLQCDVAPTDCPGLRADQGSHRAVVCGVASSRVLFASPCCRWKKTFMLWAFWCGALANRLAVADRLAAGGFARVSDVAVPVVALDALALCHLTVSLLPKSRSVARGIL